MLLLVNKRKRAGGSKAGLAVLILLAIFVQGAIAAIAQAKRTQHSRLVAPARQVSSLAYRFTPGMRLSYAFAHQTESASDFTRAVKDPASRSRDKRAGSTVIAMSDLSHAFKTYLSAEMSITVLRQTTEEFFVAYQLRDAIVSFESGGQTPEEIETVRQELNRPVFATLDSRGRILSLRLDPALRPLSHNFIKAALAVVQFVLPPRESPAAVREWQVEEEDGNGRYVAQYDEAPGRKFALRKPASHARSIKFVKTKLQYLNPPNSKNLRGVYQLAPAISSSGGFEAAIDSIAGRLLSLEGKETQTFSLANHVFGQTTSKLNLKLTKTELVGAAAFSNLLEANAVNATVAQLTGLAARPSEEETERAMQRGTLGNATLESLIVALDDPKNTSRASDTQLYLKFRALAYLHPEACRQLGERLAAADATGREAAVLTDALAAAGHDEAQDALVFAIRKRPAHDALLPSLLIALGRTRATSQLAEDALVEVGNSTGASEVSALAIYLLGEMAHNLASRSPARAARIIDRLIDELEMATSREIVKRNLLALGATTSPDALATITRFTNSTSELRVAAAGALLQFESPQADELLLKMLTTDSEAEVRYQSALSLAERRLTPSSIRVQQEVFKTETNDDVRLAVLTSIWRAHTEFPEVLQLVKRVALNDRSKAISDAAASLVATL